jgi:hypothetical protein
MPNKKIKKEIKKMSKKQSYKKISKKIEHKNIIVRLCHHCKIDINQYDKKRNFCDKCLYNNEIMIEFTELENIYKLSFLDVNKIFNLNEIKFECNGKLYFYVSDLYKYIDNVVKGKYSNSSYSYSKCLKIKETKEKNDKMFGYVLEGILLSLPKYNVPQNFIFNDYFYNLIKNRINTFIYYYYHDVHQFAIHTLDYIKLLYSKKSEIDNAIDSILHPEYKEIAKKHENYYNFILNKININHAINILLEAQQKENINFK